MSPRLYVQDWILPGHLNHPGVSFHRLKWFLKYYIFLTCCIMAIRNLSVFTRNRESSRAECLTWWIVLGAQRKVRCVSTLIKAVLLLRMTVHDTCFMINFLRTWCYWKKNDPLWEIRRWHSWVSSLQQWHRLTFIKIPSELLSSACVYHSLKICRHKSVPFLVFTW